MNNFGSYVASSYLAPKAPLTVTTGVSWEYIRVINNSSYQLSINLSGMGSIIMPEFYMEDLPIPQGYNGQFTITPQTNVSSVGHSVSNIIIINAYVRNELSNPVSQPLAQPAVTTTATGKPIYSATIGFGTTSSNSQWLNVYNPANSGTIYTFHSARLFVNDGTAGSRGTLYYAFGSDYNMATPVAAANHSGSSSPTTSTSHCTSTDSVTVPTSTGAAVTIETLNTTQNNTVDFLAFPDVVTSYPGTNILIQFQQGGGGAVGYVARLTLKWTEDIVTPIIAVPGGVNVASSIKNDGNIVSTQIVESTVVGDGSSAVILTNDAQFTLGDAAHNAVLTLLGNIVQTGNITETGNITLTGILAAVGAINPNIAALSTINGATSGTCTTWQPFQGSAFNLVVLIMNNYQDASNRSITLTTSFAHTVGILVLSDLGVSGNGGFQLLNNVTAQNLSIISAVAAVGGTGTTQTSIFKQSFGYLLANGVIDHINVLSSTTAHSGIALFVGN